MNDMSPVIVPKSDQINADDLIGGDKVITIREVHIKGGQEQPVSIYFDGSDKAYRPCKSMSRVLVAAWGPDAKKYVGRSVQLYRDPTVKWGGMEVGGIRIRAMTDIEDTMTMALTATKGSRRPYTVKPLRSAPTDKVAAGVADLLKRLHAAGADKAAIVAEADVVKQRAWLAKNRPELAAEVDTAVAGASVDEDPFGDQVAEVEPESAESPADAQGGDFDPMRELADRLMADARSKETLPDLVTWETESQVEYETLTEDLRLEVDGVIAECRQQLGAK